MVVSSPSIFSVSAMHSATESVIDEEHHEVPYEEIHAKITLSVYCDTSAKYELLFGGTEGLGQRYDRKLQGNKPRSVKE